MSNYREMALLLAQLPQKEFDRVIKNVHEIEVALVNIQTAMARLGGALEVAKPPDKDETEEAAGLCPSCASPCPRKADGTSECRDYHQFMAEVCPRCYFWDVEVCQNGNPCVEGKGFVLKEDAVPV